MLPLRPSQEPCRKGDDGFEQIQHCVHGNSNNAERDEKEPDDGIENKGYKSERPAND
jgi:hypothetical protein